MVSHFHSIDAWWHMGGYALYVWTAYGVVITVLLLLSAVMWMRWRQLLRAFKENSHTSHDDVHKASTSNI